MTAAAEAESVTSVKYRLRCSRDQKERTRREGIDRVASGLVEGFKEKPLFRKALEKLLA